MLLKLLSLNIWDLPIPFPPFDRRRRRRNLLEHLTASTADLVLFQEAFIPGFKAQLASSLPGYQADDYVNHRRRPFFVLSMDGSGGLTTFSRLALNSSRYIPFRLWPGMKPDERVGRKGCLWTLVNTPAGSVLVGNVHLYAGGGPGNGRARAMQTRHLLHQLEEFPRMPTIIAGDFNMAIEFEQTTSGPTGFDLMHKAGFTEIASGTTGSIATMSRVNNHFARFSPFHQPERRLTQIFYRGDGLKIAEPPALCFREPAVSDHYGLQVTISIT